MMSLTIISTILFFGFIILGVVKFGILTSYSAYSSKWGDAIPIKDMNLWSIVTIISALLLTPPLIESGANDSWQFLGFLTPIYLIVVALTPNWETNNKEHIVHTTFALLCIITSLLWLFLVKQYYIQLILIMFSIMIAGTVTGTLKRCFVFWLEMLMFLSNYGALYA